MNMLPITRPSQRLLRRFILTATIVPAILAASASAADINWNGPVALNTGDPGLDDIHVQSNTILTLTNTGPLSILENTIFFEPAIATETLTINGAGLELRANSTVLSSTNSKAITINGDGDFAPGALYTGPGIGVAR